MKNIRSLLLLAALILVAGVALGDTNPNGFDSGEGWEFSDKGASGFWPNFQVGMMTRVGGSQLYHDKKHFLVVGNMDIIQRVDSGLAWGAGLRFISDDDGTRYGLRVVSRYNFAPHKTYIQFAPWVAVTGQDNHRTLRFPGYGAELEVGHQDWAALTLGLEVIDYRDYVTGILSDHPFQHEEILSSGTDVSWYLGGKLNGPWKVALGYVAMLATIGLTWN